MKLTIEHYDDVLSVTVPDDTERGEVILYSLKLLGMLYGEKEVERDIIEAVRNRNSDDEPLNF